MAASLMKTEFGLQSRVEVSVVIIKVKVYNIAAISTKSEKNRHKTTTTERMTSPPSHIFQQILQSFRDHPDDDFEEHIQDDGQCIDCSSSLNQSGDHGNVDYLEHDHGGDWRDVCSKCWKQWSERRSSVSSVSSMRSDPPHVHWPAEANLVRSHPRKKYVRNPRTPSPVKPILKNGKCGHR
ncbi:hypothetical protein LOTGIDRAFT_227897 [Lottia gigantea]|uniref:Uncharacterized protein n=1 Tax=Lottia gigantea TaxID=225164 RepID=V4BH24_LOTGI|nr:hypothetical protein LOTGIDRAFT_227897 [Lottia gigantea]ESP05242.1 hypothetical protein LOTGIDRAFT_227897 [Lottia gigantea]